jgi:hypothetical protein
MYPYEYFQEIMTESSIRIGMVTESPRTRHPRLPTYPPIERTVSCALKPGRLDRFFYKAPDQSVHFLLLSGCSSTVLHIGRSLAQTNQNAHAVTQLQQASKLGSVASSQGRTLMIHDCPATVPNGLPIKQAQPAGYGSNLFRK